MTSKEKHINKLDLNKIEEKLDNALENETSESLTNWFKEKRDKNNNMAQTSVEWLFETMAKTPMTDWYEVLEQAKAMHKEEKNEDMRKAFSIGHQCARQGSYNAITEQEDFDKWKELGYPIIFEQYKKQ